MHLACKLGNEDIALLLIDRLSAKRLVNLIVHDATNGVCMPLHSACKNKTEKYLLVESYLKKIQHETQLNKCLLLEDESKQTILHIAIENNHLNIVELLLRDYGMSTEVRDTLDGNLPIHCGAKNGSHEMFNLLQKYDAVSFLTNRSLQNALHIAAFHDRSRFISEFLDYEQFCLDQVGTIITAVQRKFSNPHGCNFTSFSNSYGIRLDIFRVIEKVVFLKSKSQKSKS